MINVARLSGEFLSQVAQEPPVDVVELILTALPWTRGRTMYDDTIWPDVQRVYEECDPRQMRAAIEYLHLRYRFFEMLETSNVGFRHVNGHQITKAQAAYMKLSDRLLATTPGRVSKRRTWIKAKPPKSLSHGWLN